jgi:hypothetical protein
MQLVMGCSICLFYVQIMLVINHSRKIFKPGGIAETQEVLDFCAKHNITADIVLILANQINEAFDRLEKGDVKYRFVINMALLKKNITLLGSMVPDCVGSFWRVY